jgi:hypothetical protein
MLYDSTLLLNRANEVENSRIMSALESTSTRITQFSRYLFGDAENVDYEVMSPFVPYSLYQAAIVQFRLYKKSNRADFKEATDSLKEILGYFSKRWLIAGIEKSFPSTFPY